MGGTFHKPRGKMPTVLLSDGDPCEVRTLGIFELDSIKRDFLGPFTFTIKVLGGGEKEAELDISKYEELGRPIPTPPDIPEHELKENTEQWYQFRDWQLYQSALHHGALRLESISVYCDSVADYILQNCVSVIDGRRIVTDEDWKVVYTAAMVPQITEPMIIQILRDTYQATFNDQDIFDALDKAQGGSGAYNAIRLWENEWANEMGYGDIELAIVPVEERARRVVAKFLRGWMEFLEMDKTIAERSLGAFD
jgi:hypothetical protein